MTPKLGLREEATVTQLARALRLGRGARRRRNAARALAHLGVLSRAAVYELSRALTDPSAEVRLEAARALGRLGPAALCAAPSLSDAAADDVPEVRAAVDGALRALWSGLQQAASAPVLAEGPAPSESGRRGGR